MLGTAPRSIGPFRVLRSIGAGGMGVVYEGFHLQTGRPVAIKTVPGVDAAYLATLRREIAALAGLAHPGIVRVLEHGVKDGTPWFAMELHEGLTLRRYVTALFETVPDLPSLDAVITTPEIPGGGVPAPRGDAPPLSHEVAGGALSAILTLARGICEPLAYLHGEGLVHRDLKPDNVIVDSEGRAVLIDFGLASQLGTGAHQEHIQVLSCAGTPAYLSPEAAGGGELDARSDLYALGCLLYELLAGRPPFLGTPVEVVAGHFGAPPIPLGALVRGVPPRLDALVLGLLAKDARLRIGYAVDVARELEALGATPRATEPRPRPYVYRSALRGRPGVAADLEGFRRAVKGSRGGRLVLAGESGLGKTRLLSELCLKASRDNVLVLVGSARPPERSGPFEALRAPLQALADRWRASLPAEARHALRSFLPVVHRYAPELAELLGPRAREEEAALPPAEARQAAIGALVDVLLAASGRDSRGGERGVLLALDDLQWADDLTVALLAELERRRPHAVAVAGAWRAAPGGRDLAEIAAAGEVRHLDPLPAEAIAEIVGDMLALESPSPSLVAALGDAAGGNPLHVAECLRDAIEREILRREPGGGWIAGELDRLPLQDSLRKVMARRVAAVASPARELLECAAVVGSPPDDELLAAASGLDEASFLGACLELRRRRLLEESPAGLAFVHDGIREAADAATPPERRRALHRAVADLREPRAGDDPLRLATLAHHRLEGGEEARAAAAYLGAARGFAAAWSRAEAERCYGAASRLLPAPSALGAGARLELADLVLDLRSALAHAEELYVAVEEEARQLGDARRRVAALKGRGACAHRLGDLAKGRRLLEEARGLARQLGLRALEWEIVNHLGQVVLKAGRTREAQELWRESRELQRDEGSGVWERTILLNLGSTYVMEGARERGIEAFTEALALSREAGDLRREAIALGNLGVAAAGCGEIEEAQGLAQSARRIARRIGDLRAEIGHTGLLAILARRRGDVASARRHHRAVIRKARRAGDGLAEANALEGLGTLAADAGHAEEAHRLYDACLERARVSGAGKIFARSHLNLGFASLRLGSPGEARRLFEEGTRLAREIAYPRVEAVALAGLALADLVTGGDPAVAERRARGALGILESAALPDDASLPLCALGHALLAQGGSAAEPLERARALGDLGAAHFLAVLARAEAARIAGDDLVRGHAPEDVRGS